MAQGPSDTILVAIRITLRIWESKVRNPDPPDRRRFVLSEHRFLVLLCRAAEASNRIVLLRLHYDTRFVSNLTCFTYRVAQLK